MPTPGTSGTSSTTGLSSTQANQISSLQQQDQQNQAFLMAVTKETNKYNVEIQAILTAKTNAEAVSRGT